MGENGYADGTAVVEREGQVVVLELSIAEAHALRNWLLQPLSDGSTALDDPPVKASVAKLGAELDFVEAVSAVRTELEDSGLPTHGLSDTEIAELGRRISQTSAQRLR